MDGPGAQLEASRSVKMSSAGGSKLDEIVAQRRRDVAAAKLEAGSGAGAALAARAAALARELGAPLDLREAVRAHAASFGAGARAEMFVAAEFKRASPSKGDFLSPEEMGMDAGAQAVRYASAGAGLVSVLTEPKWFKGSLGDLESARRAVNGLAARHGSRPLVLRKDFVVDEFQLLEARAYGADTVLLMLSILSEAECAALLRKAHELGMEPLVEVVNEQETLAALRCGAKVLGVNNRNLHTFVVDMQTTPRVVQIVRDAGVAGEVAVLALSGIKSRDDVVQYEQFGGIAGLLVGEALMKAADPAGMIAELVRSRPSAASTAAAAAATGPRTRVKVCGINEVAAALTAAKAGADMIGLIFVQKSVRCCSEELAKQIVQAVRAFRERPGRVELRVPAQAHAAAATGAALPALGATAPPAPPPQPQPQPEREQEQHRTHHQHECVDGEAWFTAWADTIGRACQGRARPLVVGVFMDQPIDEVNRIAEATGIDLIQLHGKETKADEARCTLPVLRVVHVDSKASAEGKLPLDEDDLLGGPAAAVLLDTSVKGAASGGTGLAFDWAIARRVAHERRIPIIMAGGLTPDNVAHAVAQAQPWAVDVASGVESMPGVKDHDKIRAFIRNAKNPASKT